MSPDCCELIQLDCGALPSPAAIAAHLHEQIVGAAALISLLNRRIDAALLDAAGPKLRLVANYAVGYDNIDVAAATARGIWVSNTPGVLTEATADLTWAALLAITRRVVEGDRLVRSGGFVGWGPLLLLGSELRGKTLGIVGLGAIGKAVARRARGFGLEVLYAERPSLPAEIDSEGIRARACPLPELLRRSDIVSLHTPLTPETRHLLGADKLALLKKGAYLINTARGPVVDETALVARLRAGQLRGAAFDVYEREPVLSPGLAELDNVVLLPHLGSATDETRLEMAQMVAADVLRVLDGQPPKNAVNAVEAADRS